MNGTTKLQPETAEPPMVVGLRVILLDDQEFDHERMQRLLSKSKLAIECEFAGDISVFSRLIETQDYDIAFIDYHLVEGDGLDAVRLMRDSARNGNTPAVMLSSNSDPELIVEAMQNGCASFMTKERMSIASLTDTIGQALADVAKKQEEAVYAAAIKEATQDILDGIAKTCDEQICTNAKKIFRTVNFLRSCNAQGLAPDPATFDMLEDACGRILRFLDELEVHCQTWTLDKSRPN